MKLAAGLLPEDNLPCIRLITFDLDDTLWAVDPVIRNANQVLCTWLEAHVPQFAHGVSVTSLVHYRAEVLADAPELAQFVTRLRLQILRRMLTDSGVAPGKVEELANAAFEAFLHARHAVDYHPRAVELLEGLARRYSLAALSNGNADVKRLEIGRYFDFAISAESAGVSKPAPEMFYQACERADCKPAEALHIGDHPEHDVIGALRAGLHAIWVNQNGDKWGGGESVRPFASVTCLSEIPHTVDAIERQLASQKREGGSLDHRAKPR